MTDDEVTDEEVRKDAEQLTGMLRHLTPLEHSSYIRGYAAACEDKRAEHDSIVMDLADKAHAERARAAKLIEALREIRSGYEKGLGYWSERRAESAINEYEASK